MDVEKRDALFNMFAEKNGDDQDPYISKCNFKTVLQLLKQIPTDSEIDDVFRKYDTDQSENISQDEFNVLVDECWQPESDIRNGLLNAFLCVCKSEEECDDDLSRKVNLDDLFNILKTRGEAPFNDDEEAEFKGEMDRDGDGCLSIQELIEFIVSQEENVNEEEQTEEVQKEEEQTEEVQNEEEQTEEVQNEEEQTEEVQNEEEQTEEAQNEEEQTEEVQNEEEQTEEVHNEEEQTEEVQNEEEQTENVQNDEQQEEEMKEQEEQENTEEQQGTTEETNEEAEQEPNDNNQEPEKEPSSDNQETEQENNEDKQDEQKEESQNENV